MAQDFVDYFGSKTAASTVGTTDKLLLLQSGVVKQVTSALLGGVTGNARVASISVDFDGTGDVIVAGTSLQLRVPFACTITDVTALADQTGSIVVDIQKDTYANYPPTGADSICASAKPTISAAAKSTDSTLTGWTTSIAAGDILRFYVDSCSTITRATIALTVSKT